MLLIDVQRIAVSTQSPAIHISETVALVEDDCQPFAE
jgi:hypothetical protein